MANELREDKNGRRRQRNDRSAAYPPSDAPQRRRPSAFSSDREVQGRTRQCILHALLMGGIMASRRISSLTLSQGEY